MSYANLHLHSTYSDGVHSAETLCGICYGMGYRALALTDHQTPKGYRDLVKAAERLGMETILGMELYGFFQNFLCHLTAYDFDPTENKMAEFLRGEEDAWYALTKAQFDTCVKNGVIRGITWQDVLDHSPAHAQMCNEQVFATLIDLGFKRQQDYWEWIKTFKSIPVDEKYNLHFPTAEEMIRLVRGAGGVVMLAHPHRTTHLLPGLYDLGLRGAEYSHPDIDAADTAAVLLFASSHPDFYLTGGTDHSGLPGNSMLRGDQPNRKTETQTCGYIKATNDPTLKNGCTEFEWLELKSRAKG